ncbi:MAG: thio(seleno)oxazole modification radical SAM maturase SbtM [Desulfovermiculus sp.]|nr:thio(seleno)oxazole modification radical SAM maturase SbtM [Desulfovermiculus sp.]
MQGKNLLEHLFPACRKLMGERLWSLAGKAFVSHDPGEFSEFLQEFLRDGLSDLQYLPDLARLELAIARVRECSHTKRIDEGIAVHPCLELLELEWTNVCSLVPDSQSRNHLPPDPGREKILVWPEGKGQVQCRPATDNDLLALKLVVEGISVPEAAGQTGYRASRIWPVINQAVQNNILIRGQSLIQRKFPEFEAQPSWAAKYLTADVFTLQWHVTQACDLKCRHCYGRESRNPLDLDRAMYVLDDFDRFCRQKNVHGQISFTGGNPMLYPHLATVHEAAVDRGFTVGILGNPAPEEQLKELQLSGPVSFYQLSLEGLAEHNDFIRGSGHYQSVLDFLDTLKKLGIFSMVMLTLTKANTRQVLDLAESLQGRADLFTFNRLSMVGSGAYLTPADKEEFKDLLYAYQNKAKDLKGVGFKDNLFNLVRYEQDGPLFGGCTGYGCGAAFNFVAVLCDGEVHACRKFPSPLGNVFSSSLQDIYDSQLAQRYREGPTECKGCPIRPVCRGCLAVVSSSGLDVFQDKDPYCFV